MGRGAEVVVDWGGGGNWGGGSLVTCLWICK